MTTVRIDIPDDQAATLKAKAAAQGLSLEEWFRALAAQGVRPRRGHHTLAELMQQCDSQAELSSEDREWIEASSFGREVL